ncbi:MAG TPA: hypothetical protein VLF95_06675 [Vicinamibacteria bacterium]|nr:hypothetical protein [Vicinamibacteria bacterium]
MLKKRSRASGRAALASASLLAASAANAAPPLALSGWDARAVETARTGALRRLESEECRKVFSDFSDAEGRTLRQNLEKWTASPATFVGLIPFVDGSRERLCRKSNVALVAQPGVRRVFVCRAFAEVQLRQPAVAEAMLIHEILHTLGLDEAPAPGAPTSLEITQRVEARCH